ncbi:MAG: hypothetical protein A2268_04245 [Candidatus Raymondbacteria bacterium RifOxyA12_full_50_37]|uniref:Type II secretion system protein GspI C-terminal domain-containing protein n=1 Tax=Candidatus Raymondbacteria bacterium RIFOXYD12_FULL_49_13 TaxID=1817890 RepID=A0A1F7FBB4_UNCRA|nr:MAG: hypothetical protein A2268_04245 [Candidatus Raymondbacteria bacterium RifOxyA12_full_50_37]OGJ92278.1 MAG: hypothetical protein A2350_14830 [Candidatus Raymondbacteria bacterium RifOxyB12_full_50_8]OGJ92566.1 MAG: hypothetical protein A2248_05705 [Candidatus Raymondbacteria bacterium RIFOXYA2_FULL_49_16]OGJ97920.1 MAG: hypothetical protein A2453_02730 [Candidatus Raymondbacteria bacterium RIFOXYC2_FULL_50_21]OGK03965.1 MAG: hypothetical protein A2519_04555 [Candidatus Raymondbacteria b
MMNEKGFTMAEVLAALVIFSLVAVPATLTMTRIAKGLKTTDKVLGLRIAQESLNTSLADESERYNIEREVMINDKKCKIIRMVEENDLSIITVSVFCQRRPLASLKGYIFRRS